MEELMGEDLALGIFSDSDRVTVVGKTFADCLEGSDCWLLADDWSDGAVTGTSCWSGVAAREAEVSES